MGSPTGSATVSFEGYAAGSYTAYGMVIEADGTIVNCSNTSFTLKPLDTCGFGTPTVEVSPNGSGSSATYTRTGTAQGTFSWTVTGPDGIIANATAVGALNSPGGAATISYAGFAGGNYSYSGQIIEASGSVINCGQAAITVGSH